MLLEAAHTGYYDAQIDSDWAPSDGDAGVLWFTIDAGPRTRSPSPATSRAAMQLPVSWTSRRA
jgi:hypothetical protein